MHFNTLIPELAVTDCAVSLKFYCSILGFSIAYQRLEEGFAFLEYGEAQLMIDQINKGRTFKNSNVSIERPFGRGINLQIKVPAVTVLFEQLHTAGITLYLSLEEKWHRYADKELRQRQFIVADPDGYLLRFYENLGVRNFL